MRKEIVREGETLAMLSARLGIPGCMLLRANRLYSPAWLLPGREIDVPEDGFCRSDGFRCPTDALHSAASGCFLEICADGRPVSKMAAACGIPERLLLRAANRCGGSIPRGTRLRLPIPPGRCIIVTAMPCETMESLADTHGQDIRALREINAIWGTLYPGMRVMIPQ